MMAVFRAARLFLVCLVALAGVAASRASAQSLVPLNISVIGSGLVTSASISLHCQATCAFNNPVGRRVPLAASPSPGFAFAGWSGACSGTGPCAVTMDTARTVTATFTQSPVWVSVAVSGGGRVVGSSGGVDCGLACVAGFPLNAQLSLAALPANGYAFTGWGGACSGVGYCSLTMDRIQGVTAGFVPAFPLSLLANPGGVVTLAPGGNSCQGICVLNFRSGSSVTLSAAPASGWRFADWGGACYGVSGDCTVTMNAAQNVTANFLTP